MKGWFITGVVVTVFYFVFGIAQLAAERPLFVWSLLVAIISLIGIIQYARHHYRATKICWITSGIMGIPLGILLIIAGVKIGKVVGQGAHHDTTGNDVTHSAISSCSEILGPGEILCASCGQTFYGQIREDGSCPLCGGAAKPQA
jgi:hypothetical protein